MASRTRQWADRRFAGVALVAGVTQQFDLLSTVPNKLDTLTVVRVVGDVICDYLVNVTSVDSLSIVDMGIGVSSVEAFGIGGGALPSPAAEDEYPPRGWIYIASLPVTERVSTDGLTNVQARFTFDLRAMRKIDKGTLFMNVIQANITIGGAMQMTGRIRALCLT